MTWSGECPVTADTVIDPTDGVDFTTVALSIVNALPAPELRGQAFLALLRSAVHSGMDATMPDRPGGPAPKHPAR
jgi:hypothetical protein